MTVTLTAGTFPSMGFKFSFPGAETLDQKLCTIVGAASAFSMAVCEKARLGGSLRFREPDSDPDSDGWCFKGVGPAR